MSIDPKLPRPIRARAEDLLTQLQAGVHFSTLKGKRLNFDRTLISIPIGARHRLLLREIVAGRVQPLAVMTHSAYNTYIRRR